MIVSEQSSSTFYEERGIHIRAANYKKQYSLMWRTIFNADVHKHIFRFIISDWSMEGPEIQGPKVWLDLNRKSEAKIISFFEKNKVRFIVITI